MIVSLPNCRSMRFTKLKLCVCVGRVLSTPPNSTPGQEGIKATPPWGSAAEVGACAFRGVGLPAEIPYGPNVRSAAKLWLVGKQLARVTRPAGVGVSPVPVYSEFCEISC